MVFETVGWRDLPHTLNWNNVFSQYLNSLKTNVCPKLLFFRAFYCAKIIYARNISLKVGAKIRLRETGKRVKRIVFFL